MSYEDKYGITEVQVVPAISKLEISSDEFDSEEVPVLLYVPHKGKGHHHHIIITRAGAENLHDWLGKFLGK